MQVNLGYLLVITVALYIAAASLAKTFAGVITPYFAAGLAGLLSLLVLLSLRTGKPLFSTRGRQGKSEEEALLSVQDGAAAAESLDFTFLQSLVSLDFWIIFFIFFAGIGSGIAVVNNLPEIVISRLPMSYNGTTIPQEEEPHVNTIHTFVVLFSVFNTFGRLLSGYLSDALRRHLTRPAWLMISTTLMAVVQLVFVWASVDVMYAAVVLLGLSYGTFFCMIPTFVSEAFGEPTPPA